MPDAPPPHWSESLVDDRRDTGPLTPDRIEAILADFRDWLEGLGEVRDDGAAGGASPLGLGMLIDQFTALRHEVNLQTRATRAATDQVAEALKELESAPNAADPTEAIRPLVSTLLDVSDALRLSLQQVERARASADSLLADLTRPRRSGFFTRLFQHDRDDAAQRAESATRLARLLAGVAEGYAVSLRRVQRALAPLGVEAVSAAGRPFDPERMEAIEVVMAPDRPAGTVVEEVRCGYEWNGKLFRPAQVKVAG